MSGATNEVIVSQAFARLLEDWANDQKLIFVQQYAYETPQKTLVRPDGVVLHDIRVPLGWSEAKDTADDLDKEIEKKLRKGYPQDNIVFENGETAVLVQNRAEVLRCDMTDPAALEKLGYFATESAAQSLGNLMRSHFKTSRWSAAVARRT